MRVCDVLCQSGPSAPSPSASNQSVKPANNPRVFKGTESKQPQKKQDKPVSRLIGIDSKLAQTILDEVVEK